MIDIDHVCEEPECPHVGQRTFPGCKCHKTREQMLEAEVIRLRDRLAGAAQAVGMLWCCHVRGPDDVYAAPDYETALAWSDLLNAMNWRGDQRYPKPLAYKNPTSFEDCLIKATPAPWPHSPESHAEDLPKSIAGFAEPSTVSSTHAAPRSEDQS